MVVDQADWLDTFRTVLDFQPFVAVAALEGTSCWVDEVLDTCFDPVDREASDGQAVACALADHSRSSFRNSAVVVAFLDSFDRALAAVD